MSRKTVSHDDAEAYVAMSRAESHVEKLRQHRARVSDAQPPIDTQRADDAPVEIEAYKPRSQQRAERKAARIAEQNARVETLIDKLAALEATLKDERKFLGQRRSRAKWIATNFPNRKNKQQDIVDALLLSIADHEQQRDAINAEIASLAPKSDA